MKAFRIIVDGFPDGIYSAETASKARYIAYRASHEAGYGHKFGEIRVIREPLYDPICDKINQGIIEDEAQKLLFIHGGQPL